MRVRIRFAKLGKIRWTSHRDVARMWERAFRRVQLPVAYTAGFSPRPKVSFGLALPTGHESVAEYLDVELTDGADVSLESLSSRLSAALPVGVDATAIEVLPPGTPSLQETVTSCTWRWVVAPKEGSNPLDASQVTALMASTSLVMTRDRKGQQVSEDIRAGILSLQLLGPDEPDGVRLEAELSCRPRLIRPAQVVAAFGPGFEERDVRRIHQWISRDGARCEPLSAPPSATDAPHALERAS